MCWFPLSWLSDNVGRLWLVIPSWIKCSSITIKPWMVDASYTVRFLNVPKFFRSLKMTWMMRKSLKKVSALWRRLLSPRSTTWFRSCWGKRSEENDWNSVLPMPFHDGEPVIWWLPKIIIPNLSDWFLSGLIFKYRPGQPQKIKKI
jgi:hypothetical protein